VRPLTLSNGQQRLIEFTNGKKLICTQSEMPINDPIYYKCSSSEETILPIVSHDAVLAQNLKVELAEKTENSHFFQNVCIAKYQEG